MQRAAQRPTATQAAARQIGDVPPLRKNYNLVLYFLSMHDMPPPPLKPAELPRLQITTVHATLSNQVPNFNLSPQMFANAPLVATYYIMCESWHLRAAGDVAFTISVGDNVGLVESVHAKVGFDIKEVTDVFHPCYMMDARRFYVHGSGLQTHPLRELYPDFTPASVADSFKTMTGKDGDALMIVPVRSHFGKCIELITRDTAGAIHKENFLDELSYIIKQDGQGNELSGSRLLAESINAVSNPVKAVAPTKINCYAEPLSSQNVTEWTLSIKLTFIYLPESR